MADYKKYKSNQSKLIIKFVKQLFFMCLKSFKNIIFYYIAYNSSFLNSRFIQQFQLLLIQQLFATQSINTYIFNTAFMNDKLETRGRPKKKNDQKLPSISRKLFSEHCAVFYACCMVYVLQTFLKTKQQKRIGHSQGGFTIYQKISEIYSFQNLENDIKEWGYEQIFLSSPALNEFARTVNGCAPKFVFKEIVSLIVQITKFFQDENINSIQCLEQNQYKLWNVPQIDLNKIYKYIRFTSTALKQIKMEKWNQQISQKIKELWKPFIKIISYTVFCVINDIQKNKYLKPFFSDAEHPEETIIGQLNLEQIIEEKDIKVCEQQKQILKFQNNQQHDYQYFSPSENRNQNHSDNSLIRSNLRPVMLITHPSIQFSQDRSNNSVGINRNNSYSHSDKNLNPIEKMNLFNSIGSNASIQVKLQEKEDFFLGLQSQDIEDEQEDIYSKIIIDALKPQKKQQQQQQESEEESQQIQQFQGEGFYNNQFFGLYHKKVKKDQS